ncbi:MAG: hypothetical protein IRZ13_16090 [Acetobacteraceae bacterium]|nr:hypothetical protein [Acetobacteraceae bacterium]
MTRTTCPSWSCAGSQLRSGEASGLYFLKAASLPARLREGLPRGLQGQMAGEAAGDVTQLPNGELVERLDTLLCRTGPERT